MTAGPLIALAKENSEGKLSCKRHINWLNSTHHNPPRIKQGGSSLQPRRIIQAVIKVSVPIKSRPLLAN